MKKLYTLIFAAILFQGAFSQATCTLDPAFVASNKKGIWPDSATNFISGTVGVPYLQNLTVKVPKDTVVNPVTMCFNRIEVSSPNGVTNFNLPPGLNMLGGNTVTLTAGTFKFPGNANTCAEISGTPTTAGTYTLQFKVQPYVTPSAGTCPASPNVSGGSSNFAQPTTLMYYKIVINEPNGLKEEVSARTFKLNNVPNPVNGKTRIIFNVQDEARAKITVYNLLGSKVYEENLKTTYGDNKLELDCSEWNGGVYLYTVQYKNHSETKRMVVNATHE